MAYISCNLYAHFGRLQSNNPHGGGINPLGKYLMTSLFFVISAMIEFAGIMYVQRRKRLIGENKVTNIVEGKNSESFIMEQLTIKIDSRALIIFSFTYLLFNFAYWPSYLM